MATDGDIKMEYPHVQKKPTNTNEEKIQIDPTPPTTPPNHQPRTSQDFKMRILTKKKVNLPPSANNHSRANLESLRGSQFKKQYSEVESSGTHELSKTDGSSLQKQKVVTYELCQNCGGQRPAGLP